MKKQLPKLALTAALALATTLTLSCGNHSFEEWENILFGSSSSEEDDNYSSSSFKLNSSSSLRQSSSSSQQQSGIIVAPLIKTKWNQGSPYNDLFPMVDGSRKVTDCGTTAMVQIMKFHNYPPRGKGESSVVGPTSHTYPSVSVPLTSLDVAYDWNNMLNEYTTANPGNEQQRNAVATLMYHFGLARGIGGGWKSIMIDNFGYDKSFQVLYREYYSDTEWEAVIRKHLDLGLPVYAIVGSSVDIYPTHAVVIDGYDNAGKFHINWGWSGGKDGYYSVTEPMIANYNFNLGVTGIYINIKPDAGSIGSNEMALDSFTVSKTTVSQNDGVTVTAKIMSAGIFPEGQAGVALVNNSGNIVAVIGTINYNALNPSSKRTSTIKFSVPYSVNPGQYNLRIVTKMNGETDWKIITRSLPNVPKSIPFTVTAGTETGVKGGGYGLWLGKLESEKASAAPNEGFKVSCSLKNVSSETFPATAGVALMDYDNNIVAILNTWEISLNANSGTSRTATYKVPSTVAPGQYKLRIVVKTKDNDEWRVVTIAEGDIQTFIDFTVQ